MMFTIVFKKIGSLINVSIDYVYSNIFFFKTVLNVFSGWQSSSSECKSKYNSYLLGDVNLTDPKQACALIQGQPLGLSWLGIAKELYISIDGGKFQYNKCI